MDIQKQRVGGYPQGNVNTSLSLGNQVIDEKNAVIKCETHVKQPIIAYNVTTQKLVCKLCLFIKPQAGEPGYGQGPPKIIPTALITKGLKTQFDQIFNEYKQNLCDVSEMTQDQNIQDIFRQQTKQYFQTMREQVAMAKQEVIRRVMEESVNLKELDQIIQDKENEALINHEQIFRANPNSDKFVREKIHFDNKLDNGRYAYIAKNNQYYNDLIGSVDETQTKMHSIHESVNHLMKNVIQVKPIIQIQSKNDEQKESIPYFDHIQRGISEQVAKDIQIDPSNEMLERILESQNKQEMIQGLEQECDGQNVQMVGHQEIQQKMMKTEEQNSGLSLSFSCSSNLLASSESVCYSQYQTDLVSSASKQQKELQEFDKFDQNISSQVFQIRSQNLCLYDEISNSWIRMLEMNNYNCKIVRVEQQIFIVGGSRDPQCIQPLDEVKCYNIDQSNIIEKKCLSYRRGKIGVCAVQLKVDAKQLIHKYLIAFGGYSIQKNQYNQCQIAFSKIVEKYNIRANVWQTLPELNIGRYNASGFMLGEDNFYVFGGRLQSQQNGDSESFLQFEKLNMRNYQNQFHFELLEVQIPSNITSQISEFGISIQSNYECLIYGGYSQLECKSLENIYKFSTCSDDMEKLEMLMSEEGDKPEKLKKSDFFSTFDMMNILQTEKYLVLGQQCIHSFDQKEMKFEGYRNYEN